jgi:hypothetical protein
MNEALERSLLESEVQVFIAQIQDLGGGIKDTSPKQDGTLDHLSIPDLRQLHRSLRDTIRTLGGAKGT